MKLSANRAAKEAGIAKATLLDAIKNGRLSASKNDKNHWEIEAAELFRVFPKTTTDQSIEPPPTPQENRQNHTENRVLEAELKAERVIRERLEAEIEDMKAQRDSWQRQAETLLLAKPSETATEAPRKRWRLFG